MLKTKDNISICVRSSGFLHLSIVCNEQIKSPVIRSSEHVPLLHIHTKYICDIRQNFSFSNHESNNVRKWVRSPYNTVKYKGIFCGKETIKTDVSKIILTVHVVPLYRRSKKTVYLFSFSFDEVIKRNDDDSFC